MKAGVQLIEGTFSNLVLDESRTGFASEVSEQSWFFWGGVEWGEGVS